MLTGEELGAMQQAICCAIADGIEGGIKEAMVAVDAADQEARNLDLIDKANTPPKRLEKHRFVPQAALFLATRTTVETSAKHLVDAAERLFEELHNRGY